MCTLESSSHPAGAWPPHINSWLLPRKEGGKCMEPVVRCVGEEREVNDRKLQVLPIAAVPLQAVTAQTFISEDGCSTPAYHLHLTNGDVPGGTPLPPLFSHGRWMGPGPAGRDLCGLCRRTLTLRGTCSWYELGLEENGEMSPMFSIMFGLITWS